MASSVFYRFNSRKDESRVTFDGTGISVFDLKRDIIIANGLGKANDFDLHIYDSTSKQEYRDDTTIIPRSSSVIVKRLPSARPGKGKASMYLAGTAAAPQTADAIQKSALAGTWHKGSISKRFDIKEEPTSSSSIRTSPVTASGVQDDEAAAMAAMFKAQTENWEEAQEKMSQATRVYSNSRGTGFSRGGGKPHQAHQQDKPLPPSYVCYRCGQKGHWIQDCPTNNDREFDHRPRIKRTTGIPRSMLKAVENPNSGEIGQGVMVTPEGGYVVAQPDVASWQKQLSRARGLTAADVRDKAPTDSSLACPIDNKLFRNAVRTPCCGTVYCEECVETHLLERDFTCPNCSKKISSLDKLIVDKPARIRVSDYIEKAIEESRKEGEEDENGARVAGPSTEEESNLDNPDFYDEQAIMNMDMQLLLDKISQLQASIYQVSLMLQKSDLPTNIRRQTEMYHQQLQNELQQAQAMTVAYTAAQHLQAEAQAQQQQQMQQMQQMQANMAAVAGGGVQGGPGWSGNPYGNQQQGGPNQDSAYQRLPVNNRRKNLKRERPSDFLEVGGEEKIPRYWE
ncbi:DWNN-domain-containing protein [Pluteus cervinus]|uniref:DWNN-domain-containing protein n=1 Tax=Pluteus cervinus TaxID=181527 RepID=A0ACD3B7U5_9AGAR|nr:DWNN-domain-containing protein [Pluteus cervinus]